MDVQGGPSVISQNNLRLTPAVFSHTGQIHEAFKIFVKEDTRSKLEHFEGPVKIKGEVSHELVDKVYIGGYW